MIDASGSWGVLRIFVDPQELKANKKPKTTIFNYLFRPFGRFVYVFVFVSPAKIHFFR